MKIDPNSQYIMIDLGGRCFTHYPSGDTLLRHDYLRWQRQKFPDWKASVLAFVARHPETHLMTDTNLQVIDDIRTWPTVGGEYKVGDFVVARGSRDRPLVAREIVGAESALGYPDRSILDFDQVFILEDGEKMWWSSDSDCWSSRDHLGNSGLRLRPVLPGENLSDMLYPSADMALRLASDLGRGITQAVHSWGLNSLVTPLSREQIASDLTLMGDALAGTVTGFRTGEFALTDVVARIQSLLDWAREMDLFEKGKRTDLDHGATDLVPAARRATAVLETLQKRGLEEVVALTP